MSLHPSDHLSTTFAALADPTRRAILARLASGETSVKELAKPFDMSLPAVTKHLKVLQRAGLITQGRQAQWRPCRLDAAPLRDIADWVEQYRRFWDESFDRLEAYLHELQAKEQKNDRQQTLTRKTLRNLSRPPRKASWSLHAFSMRRENWYSIRGSIRNRRHTG